MQLINNRIFYFYIARWTLPERRHLVHTWIVFGVPLTTAFIFCTFGAHFLFVFRLEWLADEPDITLLLHISHFLDIKNTSLKPKSYILIDSNIIILSYNISFLQVKNIFFGKLSIFDNKFAWINHIFNIEWYKRDFYKEEYYDR